MSRILALFAVGLLSVAIFVATQAWRQAADPVEGLPANDTGAAIVRGESFAYLGPETCLNRAELVRVIDGDTLVVDVDLGWSVSLTNVALRIPGIDTPEPRGEHAAAGKWVSAQVLDFLEDEEFLWLERIGDDKYGRTVATVYRGSDKAPVAGWLIAQDYAWSSGEPKDLSLLTGIPAEVWAD